MRKKRRRHKHNPRIAERYLFPPMTCRVGGCGRDADCGVDLPAFHIHDNETVPHLVLSQARQASGENREPLVSEE